MTNSVNLNYLTGKVEGKWVASFVCPGEKTDSIRRK